MVLALLSVRHASYCMRSECFVAYSHDNSVAYHLVFERPVVSCLNESVEGCNKLFCRFALELNPPIKLGSFEDDVFPHLEELVKFGNHCIVFVSVFISDIGQG